MRSELPSPVGRDHLSFRSYYQPVRNVIDGDLCEVYNSLDIAKKKTIAEDLDRTPSEVSHKQQRLKMLSHLVPLKYCRGCIVSPLIKLKNGSFYFDHAELNC